MIDRILVFFLSAWLGSLIGDIVYNMVLHNTFHFARALMMSFPFAVSVTVGYYFGFKAGQDERNTNDAAK